MRRMFATLLVLTGLCTAGAALAAPITDPNDARTWQGVSLETLRNRLGFATRQDLVNSELLDDSIFPNTAAYAATFTFPSAPCGSQPAGISSTYLRGVLGCSGYWYDPLSWAFLAFCDGATDLPTYQACAKCLDMYAVQDNNVGDIAAGHVWDLGGPSNQVAVFPVIDHAPLPDEAIEYTVYLSNNPNAATVGSDGNTQWVKATLVHLYLEGWNPNWIADGFTTVWRLPGNQLFRYVNVTAGGPDALVSDGDDEIDTVIGLLVSGETTPARTSSWGQLKSMHR